MSEPVLTPIGDVIPDRQNANRGTDRGREALRHSLETYGAGRSILLDKQNRVIAGNKSLAEALALGHTDVEVIETDGSHLIAVKRTDLDLDEPAARELAFFDNRSGELDLSWDPTAIAAALDEGIDISHLWTGDEMEALLAGLADTGGLLDGADPDTIPEKVEPRCRPGELWALGRHRLLCGDSTKVDDVARLMGGKRAALTITSPPYNAGDSETLSGNTHHERTKYRIQGDDLPDGEYLDLLSRSTEQAISVSECVIVNLQQLAGNKIPFIEYLYRFRERLVDIAIWDKGHGVPQMAASVMNNQIEYLVFMSPKIRPSRAIPTAQFHGNVTNVYSGPPQRRNEFAVSHAATFPAHLPRWIMETFDTRQGLVYDPFIGTGTTMIAAQETGRACYGIDIDPHFCDLTIDRFESVTGETATRL